MGEGSIRPSEWHRIPQETILAGVLDGDGDNQGADYAAATRMPKEPYGTGHPFSFTLAIIAPSVGKGSASVTRAWIGIQDYNSDILCFLGHVGESGARSGAAPNCERWRSV